MRTSQAWESAEQANAYDETWDVLTRQTGTGWAVLGRPAASAKEDKPKCPTGFYGRWF